MRTKFTLLTIFSFMSILSFGQLESNTLAPDFTITDLEGNEHNLYDILDEGKTVIIDVFATWCGPCWGFHESHALEDIYNAYGPEGENDMFVFGIEADGQTNLDCIYDLPGCNSSSIGDWTAGVSYPISNNSQINGLYDINYFPTVYIIFPNKIVREIGPLSYNQIVSYRENIPQLKSGVNPELIDFRGDNGATCDSFHGAAPYFLFSNMGEENINTADISIYKNGEEIMNMQVTDTIASYGIIAEVQVTPSIVSENTVFEALVSNINGDPSHNLSVSSTITLETNNVVKVYATTDGEAIAHNNRYEIFDEDENLIASGSLAENNASITNTHFLYHGGCYNFKVYDDGGNGVDGEIMMTDGNGNLIYKSAGAFSVDEDEFNVKSVSAIDEALSDKSFVINENPVGDQLIIDLSPDLAGSINICVLNVYGQVLEHEILDNQNRISFDTKGWTQGVYFVSLQNERSKVAKQIVKQ